MDVLRFLYRNLVLLPFMQLYVQGPTLAGYGFYGGRDEAFICSSKTTMSQFFWEHHREMCREIIERDANSLIMTMACVAYLYLLVHLYLILQTVMRIYVERWLLKGCGAHKFCAGKARDARLDQQAAAGPCRARRCRS